MAHEPAEVPARASDAKPAVLFGRNSHWEALVDSVILGQTLLCCGFCAYFDRKTLLNAGNRVSTIFGPLSDA